MSPFLTRSSCSIAHMLCDLASRVDYEMRSKVVCTINPRWRWTSLFVSSVSANTSIPNFLSKAEDVVTGLCIHANEHFKFSVRSCGSSVRLQSWCMEEYDWRPSRSVNCTISWLSILDLKSKHTQVRNRKLGRWEKCKCWRECPSMRPQNHQQVSKARNRAKSSIDGE